MRIWIRSELRDALAEFYTAWGEIAGEEVVCHAVVQHRSLLRYAFAGWRTAIRKPPRAGCYRRASTVGGSSGSQLACCNRLRSPITGRVVRGNFALEPEFDDLLREVANAWGSEAPDETLDWLERLPNSRVKSETIDSCSGAGRRRSGKASTPTRPDATGCRRKITITCLAKAIDRDDPEAAQLWVESIADESLRSIGSSLLSHVPPGARRNPSSGE